MNRFDFRWAALPALCALVSGCGGEEFDPYGRLTSLRVLGIQSEPVAPGPGETTTLTPVLYVPRGQSVPTFQWSWCLFAGAASDGYPCEVDSESLGDLGGAVELPPAELGTDRTATFENTLEPALLSMLCSGSPEAARLLDCDQGFPVQVKLTVTTDEDEVVAVRNLHLRFDENASPNANPVFEGLEVRLGGDWLTVDGGFDGLIPRDEETKLRTQVSEDASESYQTAGEDGEPITMREKLNIAWFVESGSTMSEHTGYIPGNVPIDILRENEWVPERSEDYSRDTSEVILVLRDDREGLSSQRFTVGLTEAP